MAEKLNSVDLCKRISSASWRVLVYDPEAPDKLISFGTAFAVTPSGILLTARHVIANRGGFYSDPILCINNDNTVAKLFRPITSPKLKLDTGRKGLHPFLLDVSALSPMEAISCEYLPLRKERLCVGEEVIASGYAKDITLPFYLDEHVDTHSWEGLDIKAELKIPLKRQLFHKKTMIGACWPLNINNYPKPGTLTEAAQYIYGSDLVEGASGGPVVDFDGKVAAVISRKGTAGLQDYQISTTDGVGINSLPSGSGTAFSHHLVTAMFSGGDLLYS